MTAGNETENQETSGGDSDSKPVPIAFCITDLDRGGAELAMFQVVTRLDRNRWSPHVYCLTHRGRLADDFEQQGVPVTCYDLSKWNLLSVVWRLRSAFRNTRPEILQTFLYHANIIGRIAAWLAGVPFVCSGIRVAEQRSRFRLRLDRWTDRLVTKHICVSQSVATFSADEGGLPESKLTVVPNGVDVDRFSGATLFDLSTFGIPDGARVLLSVGRLEPQKAPDVMLSELSPLFPRSHDLHLLMVGAGSLESSLRDQVIAMGVADRVHFAGRQDDVPGIMRAADCLVLTSRFEGMPNVVLEAMAARLPIVSTLAEGVAELLADGRGMGIPFEDLSNFADVVERVLADSATSNSMAKTAQVFVAEHFTWERCADGYRSIYRELLSARA